MSDTQAEKYARRFVNVLEHIHTTVTGYWRVERNCVIFRSISIWVWCGNVAAANAAEVFPRSN